MTTTSVADLVAEARQQIENLSPAEVAERLTDEPLLVDLREPAEVEGGTIPGAVCVPRGMLEFRADPSSAYHQAEFDPKKPVILYCASGGRSALAGAALRRLGYESVAHLDGGYTAWVEAGHDTTE